MKNWRKNNGGAGVGGSTGRERAARLEEITAVFVRYGLKKGLKGSMDPVNVRHAFEELGPTFVKLGQMLSSRRDLLPQAYVAEFAKLQDSVRPERFEDIREVVEGSLGKPLPSVFPEFCPEPMASASLAQVHCARLATGERVVVKVLRPHARETMLSDISILRTLSRVYRLLPIHSFFSAGDVLDELESSARRELDFLNEAANVRRFAQLNANVRFIAVPKVYERCSSDSVLVMEHIEGVKIDDVARLEAEGYDRREIGEKLVDNYIKQIFEDGFFHADPHPGNIMVAGNKIVYIDFGLMGSIGTGTLRQLDRILLGIARGDADTVSQAVLQVAELTGPVDTAQFYREMELFCSRYLSASLSELNLSAVFGEVNGICIRNNLSIPREMTMPGKSLLTIEGVLETLSPEISIAEAAANHMARKTVREWDARRELENLARQGVEAASSTVKLPKKLAKLLDTAQQGRLSLRLEDPGHEKNLEKIGSMVNRLAFGIIDAALIIGSSIVVDRAGGARLGGLSALGIAGYAGAALLGFWLVLSMLRSGRL